MVAGLANRQRHGQGRGPDRRTKHEVGHTQSLYQLHTTARNMEGELVGSRAESVGGTLELVHLGRGQLGEQVRRNPDSLTQVQVVIGTLDTLLLTQELHRGVHVPTTRDQNRGLQAVHPKPVLGAKVTKDIQELLQQTWAVGKQGHVIRIQENTDRKDGQVGALEPGKARPVLTQVGAGPVNEQSKHRGASRTALLNPTVDHKVGGAPPPDLHRLSRIPIQSLKPQLDIRGDAQLLCKHLPQSAPGDTIVGLLEIEEGHCQRTPPSGG